MSSAPLPVTCLIRSRPRRTPFPNGWPGWKSARLTGWTWTAFTAGRVIDGYMMYPLYCSCRQLKMRRNFLAMQDRGGTQQFNVEAHDSLWVDDGFGSESRCISPDACGETATEIGIGQVMRAALVVMDDGNLEQRPLGVEDDLT